MVHGVLQGRWIRLTQSTTSNITSTSQCFNTFPVAAERTQLNLSAYS